MSNRISELPVASEAIAGNDLVAVTNVSQSGIGETQKFNWLEMQNGGWINIFDTWTYASATTITVPAGATALYSVGMSLRFKQGGAYKYFYIIKVENALLTVTGGSDYSVADVAITDIYVGNAVLSVGFPQKFNYTPTPTNLSGGTINVAKFMLVGKRVFVAFRYTCAGAGISGSVSVSLPIEAADMNYLNIIGNVTLRDSDPVTNYNGIVLCSSTNMILSVGKSDGIYSNLGNLSATVPFTWAANDLIIIEASYFIV